MEDSFAVAVVEKSDPVAPPRIISGFCSATLAREYARRRTRASLEEQRAVGQSLETLRRLWSLYGEDCFAIDDVYRGSQEMDCFLAQLATAEECDWVALAPRGE